MKILNKSKGLYLLLVTALWASYSFAGAEDYTGTMIKKSMACFDINTEMRMLTLMHSGNIDAFTTAYVTLPDKQCRVVEKGEKVDAVTIINIGSLTCASSQRDASEPDDPIFKCRWMPKGSFVK
jgi:hypothetical protein